MFSGIVEVTGTIKEIKQDGSNKHFTIQSNISHETYIDQSIAHNGVCLTVVNITNDEHTVTAIEETLLKTNLNKLRVGDQINLERSLLANSRIDGHFVQGHVDTIAICQSIKEADGSWYFHFKTNTEYSNLMVNKGSICLNGVSLTLIEAKDGFFSVAIIPYTYQHTNFSNLKVGEEVNVEFDILGKYIVSYLANVQQNQ